MIPPRDRATAAFRDAFHAPHAFVARAPGRVNLLGEHVDYNDGWVLPVAIDRAVWVAFAPNVRPMVDLAASDLSAGSRQALDDYTCLRLSELDRKVGLLGQPLPRWAHYPAGVAWSLQSRGLAVGGLFAAIASDVPVGAGLSSSAAVEVAFAVAWQKLGRWALPPLDLARTCQRAENEYVGVQSGLMDQFASACGQAGHALLLDCRTLEWQALPLPAGVSVVVADSGVRRELAGGEYNLRREQCQAAVAALRDLIGDPTIHALRDVSLEDFNRHAAALDPLVARRARHVVQECDRMRRAPALLDAGRLRDFGALMNDCHRDLRDLYEVSTPELDALAQTAQGLEGCYGARLTGAGFGGCTVNLVAADAAEAFARALSAAYAAATGRAAEIYVCAASDGAGIVG